MTRTGLPVPGTDGPLVEWSARPPGWWPTDGPGTPLFAGGRWLRTVGARQAGGRHGWVRAPGRGGRGVLRMTWTTAGSAPRSLDPFHWTHERTAYRDGTADESAPRTPRPEWFPSLVSVLPGLDTYLVGTDPGDVDCAIALLDTVIGEARAHGAATVALGFVQPGESGLAEAATRRGLRPVPMATLATLPLAGRTAADVWDAYGAKQRANARRTRRRLADAGVRVTVLDAPLSRLDELTALRCAHLREHGKTPDAGAEREHLASLLGEFGELCTVVAGLAGTEPIAFSAFLRDRDIVHAYMTGRRDARADRDVYFETNYHHPVDLFAGTGVSALSYGYGTEEAKRLRGCRLDRVYGYVGHLREMTAR